MSDTTPPRRRPDERTDGPHDAWAAAPAAAPTATLSPPPPSWYGTPTAAPAAASASAAAPGPVQTPGPVPAGRNTPHPPWFWPVVAAAIGLGALLVGGGVGFAVGHAVASHGVSSFTVPGGGSGPGTGTGQDGPRGQSGTGSSQELPGGATITPQQGS
ncbi:hypothetical protein [Curtobacterium herbarum]|uniref:Uncharacterized protein n=1 Tax=Curtobacterium herbarum TaxID=150122 RepID=A0ABN1ZFG8_9MICO|nr:hypothetical protein [Curtobacterium herbarum]MBM7474456.1 hypothetical protein [Curtobacterium herbarum]MCS6545841.1 hypothetical protein [Curtobacterium herbarum]